MTEIPSLQRRKKKKREHAALVKRASLGADLHHLDAERVIKTDPDENRLRRTLLLTKKDNSWGFTLQSYGIKHKKTNETEIMTYVDYVSLDGAAYMAGMRRGDVILSINGEKVGDVTHQELVAKIRKAGDQMRLVVLFEDCGRKVDLHDRYLKLKTVLKSKYDELKQLEIKEMSIIEAYYQMKGWNRFEHLRQSILSRASTSSDSWDTYSLISSPYNQHSTGHFDQWPSVSSLRSFNIGDDSSNFDESYMEYIDSDSESVGSTSNLSINFGEAGGMGKSRKSDSDLVTRYGHRPDTSIPSTHISKSATALNTGENAITGKRVERKGKEEVRKSCNSLSDNVFEGSAHEDEKNSGLKKVNSQKRSFPRKDQVFYSGENGKIIVPKICIEGQEVYTTLHDIDITNTTDVLPSGQQDFETNVALDFAKQMARLEQMNLDGETKTGATDSKTLPTVSVVKTNSAFRERGATWGSENRPKKIDLRREIFRNGREFHSSGNLTNNSKHLCGSLSYDQLKSSVPDIYLPFHLDTCHIVYINEKDECSQL